MKEIRKTNVKVKKEECMFSLIVVLFYNTKFLHPSENDLMKIHIINHFAYITLAEQDFQNKIN